MDFNTAAKTELKFGQFKGKTILEIAGNERGVGYLKWLLKQSWPREELKDAIETYFADADVQRDMDP